MPETLTIKIPTKPHYRKFVQLQFSKVIDNRDTLGILAFNMLRKVVTAERKKFNLAVYTDSLELEVPAWLLFQKRIRPAMQPSEIEDFNQVIENLFKASLFQFVNTQVQLGKERGIAIEMWMDNYGIYESDITHDALKKAEYRNRQDLLKKSMADGFRNNLCALLSPVVMAKI